ncbi:hypothetical protein HYH03_003756 [Edaphochlamys debaryana]|uniref:Uncharacterized protein n=1 Tax=Edaphochlamys debaryana TaxID=47281 RepID=A0A836C382_9CHLO|nr:hypothetical protein HYH03_003756 [Edaphochlamys debaryana]|eukprot:KAG2498505.1 hypothetical protein HYH03_003756 [Edaphochlamys debaryana]
MTLRTLSLIGRHEYSCAIGPVTGTGSPWAGGAPEGLKELPPLPAQSRGPVRLTVLWDLESLKPFTQQAPASDATATSSSTSTNSGPSSSSSSSSSFGAGANANNSTRGSSSVGAAAWSSTGASRGPTRLSAAGLAGSSSPDLLGALDTLCRTLQEYGAVHAVHLFVRESTLAKAPALRRQLSQLTSWAEPPPSPPLPPSPQAPAEPSASSVPPSSAATPPTAPSGSTSGAAAGRGAVLSAGPGGKTKRRGATPAPAPPHDCPLCRSTHASRLDLLRHFAFAHQGPLLAATAGDARARLTWTRGRPLTLAPLPEEEDGECADGGSGHGSARAPEAVALSPQDFVYGRELLLRGQHLDELLSAAAPTTLTDPTDTPTAAPFSDASAPAAAAPAQASKAAARPPRFRPGLHVHVAPPGQAPTATAAALQATAERLAKAGPAAWSTSEEDPSLAATSASGPRARRQAAEEARLAAGGGRGRGRGRGRGEADPGPPGCVCVVSDDEGVEEVVTVLQRRGLPVVLVGRRQRAAPADTFIRWWALQSGEYRLGGARDGAEEGGRQRRRFGAGAAGGFAGGRGRRG